MSVSAFKTQEGGCIEWYDGETMHSMDIPLECIDAIAQSGQNDIAVEEWQANLNFSIPKGIAVNHLIEYGAWSNEELESMSDIDLSQKILWIGVWNIAESEEIEE